MSSGLLGKIKNFIVPKGEFVYRIPLGLYKGIKCKIDLQHQMQFYLGLWEIETHSWLKRFSRDIQSAIDIGAASGEQTLFFLKKTKAHRIYAIEPSPGLCWQVRQNILLNHESEAPNRVELIPRFVGLGNEGDEMTLDSIFDRIPLPCLIKMDIDGGEVNALKGAGKFLRSPNIRWLIETHSYQLEKECIEILTRYQYFTKVIRNAWWRFLVPEQRPGEMNRWLIAYKRDENDQYL